jgi:hypothetical protein
VACRRLVIVHPILKGWLSAALIRTYLKNKISVQGKARNGEKAEHTRVVCEHFEPFINTAMGT